MDWSPLFISLKTAALATVVTFFLGLAAARWVLTLRRGRALVDGVFTLPMVLPPTVVGFFLLLLCGRNGPVGKFLLQFDLSVVFSWPATVLAATVVAFPMMYRTTLGALEQLDENLRYAAQTLGLSEWRIFWRILLPAAWPGVAAGTILAFARALGEFGATIMLAGNIAGRTQTMATAIYQAVQAGNRTLAMRWALIIMALSFLVIMLLNYWSALNRRRCDGRKKDDAVGGY